MYEKGKILGGLELLAALLAYGVWTLPFRNFGIAGSSEPLILATNFLSIIFLLLPVFGLWAMFNQRKSGYLALAVFPVVAYIFGVTAIPFIKYLYGSSVQVNSIIIAIINIIVVAIALWLYSKQSRYVSD